MAKNRFGLDQNEGGFFSTLIRAIIGDRVPEDQPRRCGHRNFRAPETPFDKVEPGQLKQPPLRLV